MQGVDGAGQILGVSLINSVASVAATIPQSLECAIRVA
jgi:hypothetical protein